MALLKRHQDHTVVHADRGTVGKREVVGACGQSDVVDDQVAVAVGNDLANLVLDRLEDALCRFDTGSGRRAHVQLNLPTVDGWKEIAAYKQEHQNADPAHQRHDYRHYCTPIEQLSEERDIAAAHMLKAALESLVQACESAEAYRVAMLMFEQ